MTCRVYVGEYQDRITGAAATAYVVINENGQLVKAMAQKVKTNKQGVILAGGQTGRAGIVLPARLG